MSFFYFSNIAPKAEVTAINFIDSQSATIDIEAFEIAFVHLSVNWIDLFELIICFFLIVRR